MPAVFLDVHYSPDLQDPRGLGSQEGNEGCVASHAGQTSQESDDGLVSPYYCRNVPAAMRFSMRQADPPPLSITCSTTFE